MSGRDWRAVGLVLLVLAPVGTAIPGLTGAVDAEQAPLARTGERAFVLTMEENRFNAREWPDTPLLEAYVGETMRFVVHVPILAEMHTFHLHGHPWLDPDTGRFIDAVRLDAGETHRFEQTAGLESGHAGDWLYHCHVGTHFGEGMWGLLRVYPYSVHVDGPLDGLDVRLDRLGEPVEGATFTATLRTGGPDTPSAREATSGSPVPVEVRDLGDGRYHVDPSMPSGATGELVLVARHEGLGESVARLDLDPASGYELDRDVGDVEGVLGGAAAVAGSGSPLGTLS